MNKYWSIGNQFSSAAMTSPPPETGQAGDTAAGDDDMSRLRHGGEGHGDLVAIHQAAENVPWKAG